MIFAFPVEIRATMYWIIVEAGLMGPASVLLLYAVISFILSQQVIRAFLSVPVGNEIESADIDFLFPAPIRPHAFLISKYLRSIPRRLMFILYIGLALLPIIEFLRIEFGVSPFTFILIIMLIIFLGEIGSLATHTIYCLRRYVSLFWRRHRIRRLLFYLIFMIGTFLFLSPFIIYGNFLIPTPVYNLAYLLVALGTAGQLAAFPPISFPLLLLSLAILYTVILGAAIKFTDLINYAIFEDLSIIAHRSGTATGILSQAPISFEGACSPVRALLKKDIVVGLRSPGKAVYWAGILINFILAYVFISFAPVIHQILPIPEDFTHLIPSLYLIILVLLVPLLTISAADPFKGEYGKIHLLRLAPIAPIHVTFIKFILLLVTPLMITIPFAIFFAVILGDLNLLIVAAAILPHAILLSTAMGLGLGSRYPYITQAQTQTPVALMVTYPVLSWCVMMPVVFLIAGFLPLGITWMIIASSFVSPYSIVLTLILLSWAAHSYLHHEQ
ncbi:MAG: hypothetical protein ACFFDP_05390 [Promethearchaeota archaeon]